MTETTAFLKDQQTNNPPEISQAWSTIEDLYTRKLWHQLTEKLLNIVKFPHYGKGTQLIDMYRNFISDFENKINPLSLVEILCPHVIRQFTDGVEALAFLNKIKEKVKSSDEAVILCSTAIGNIHLFEKNFKDTKAIIEECDQLLTLLPSVTSVHSRFYDLCSNYHQLLGHHNEYYKDALRYLGCTDIKDIPLEEQQERAFYLGLAGLLGSEVYNFGELLQHPVLESLRDTPRQWLIDLLYAFNSGDMGKMRQIKSLWASQPDLAANELSLRQKIMLLCLMEMTFTRPANNRHISFQEIATKTEIAPNEVEILTMKAMSLGLVKGTIDQVTEKVHMTWVQPRVLDKTQIGKMKERLDDWCKDVSEMERSVEQKAADILT
ncbi:26S proteasome non-ATPase regulatory subunit 13-like [Styela clava]|uniref:26S proteasome non-ATPase regulatory subunit 13-like n=1 Tax=Styela clava TaxID=7725 RepID=UPI001939E4F9|nr:26S proteasome non-ATPase regulatory subunit 13-like [Styela clava]